MRHLSIDHKRKLSEAAQKRLREGRNPTIFKKGHIPTLEMRAKMGAKGEKHFMWKGGITRNRKEYRNLWRKNNLEKAREYMRTWKKIHRSQTNVYIVNYRAKVHLAKGSFTPQEWKKKKEEFGNRCAICGIGGKLTIDHVVSINQGGSNFIDNIQPLCGPCNYSKHDMSMEEYLAFREKNNVVAENVRK